MLIWKDRPKTVNWTALIVLRFVPFNKRKDLSLPRICWFDPFLRHAPFLSEQRLSARFAVSAHRCNVEVHQELLVLLQNGFGNLRCNVHDCLVFLAVVCGFEACSNGFKAEHLELLLSGLPVLVELL